MYGSLTNDTSSTNLTLGDQMMNDYHRMLCSKRDWHFLHDTRTLNTGTNTTFYNLPYDIDIVEGVYVTVGSTRYTVKPSPSREFWDKLHYSTYSSDTPEYFISYDGQLGLWPRPSTAGNEITVKGKVRVIDLNTADVTANTITTLTSGSTAIVTNGGLGGNMAGFWIRPTYSTDSNKGDGHWYEIDTVTNSTTATLKRTYGGSSIASGTAACTIAQMWRLPENFHHLPAYHAAATYWDLNGHPERAASYRDIVKEGERDLALHHSSAYVNLVVDDKGDDTILNPNLHILL